MQQTVDREVLVDWEALRRVVAVINGKGGVLKTSIVANVAGRLALSGWRVLVIAFDPNGNINLDLGLEEHPGNDNGKGAVNAIWNGTPLPIVRGVRPNLDFVFGGTALRMIKKLDDEDLSTGGVATEWAARVAEAAADYDLVLMDCPPEDDVLQDTAVMASGWILIPTMTDEAGLKGLFQVGPRVKRAQKVNPVLRYLGVVITAHNLQATRSYKRVMERLAAVKDVLPVFDSIIRYSKSTSDDCRARGQLVHELAQDSETSRTERLQALRTRDRSTTAPMPPALSGTAGSVSDDYRQLAREISVRIAAAEQQTPSDPATGVGAEA